jgi:hypothetical protein
MSVGMASSGTTRPGAPLRPAFEEHGRDREVLRLRRLLERAHSPRLQMVLIVSATGAAGFLASATLLGFGVDALWLRYALAVVFAYLVFLALLWGWLYVRRDDVLECGDVLGELDVTPAGIPDVSPARFELGNDVGGHEFGGGEFGGGGASGSFADAPAPAPLASGPQLVDGGATSESGGVVARTVGGALDLEELAVVLVAIAALLGALWAALWLVWGAPVLLAELLFDAALSAGLYRRLRDVRGEHWLRTAFLRTAAPFAAVALLFSLAGGVMQHVVPEARSVGQVFESIRGDR